MRTNEITSWKPAALTDSDRDTLCKLGALNWSEADICGYFNYDPQWFHNQWNNPDSEISRLVRQGGLRERAKMELAIFAAAQGGDIDSISKFRDIIRDKSFSMSKLDLFGGTADMGAFARIQDYIVRGDRSGLSDKEAIYYDLLTVVHSIEARHGKRKTIAFLTSSPFCFSYSRAVNILEESTELYYGAQNISKETFRKKYADMFDALYHAAVEAAETSKDYGVAANILAMGAKVLRLDQEDEKALPAEQYGKQYRVLDLNPQILGLPPANRDELARQIDSMDLPATEKEKLKVDAAIQDMDIEKYLGNVISEES